MESIICYKVISAVGYDKILGSLQAKIITCTQMCIVSKEIA